MAALRHPLIALLQIILLDLMYFALVMPKEKKKAPILEPSSLSEMKVILKANTRRGRGSAVKRKRASGAANGREVVHALEHGYRAQGLGVR
ncbi:MAG: hypothetical protein Q9163_005903 [Psora crenata]